MSQGMKQQQNVSVPMPFDEFDDARGREKVKMLSQRLNPQGAVVESNQMAGNG